MSKIVASIAILCAISLALALPQYENDRKLTHFRTSSPIASRWALIGDPKPETLVQFSLALKQQNLDKLEEFFWRNSDPKSPFYAKHFTHDEVMHLVSPPKATQQKILHWLKYVAQKTSDMGGHVENIVNHGDSIMVTANVIYIEELFKTKLHSFQNANNGKIVVKHLGGLSIPSDLADIIDLITGITEFPPTQVPLSDRMDTRRNVGDEDNLCNVPYTIKQLYNVPQDLWVTNANANVSIYAEESGGVEGFGFKSVLFWEQINGLPSNPIDCILGDGASNITPVDTDMEAQLDTQMVTGMAVNAKTCFWIIDGWMYDFTQNIFHTPTSPLVVSMSYGWLEWEQCDNDTDGVDFVGNCSALHIPNSAGYVNRTNIEFMKLGLIGHTMVAASGDDGTAGNHNSPDGCTKLAPVFPGASPYVLSVGATSIEPSSATSRKLPTAGQPPICTDSDYECPCSTSTNEQPAQGSNTAGFDSGGGFSVYTPRPSYQNSAVSSYLSSGAALPAPSLGWNQNGRGYPDIGAVGENFCVVDPGESCNLVAGTSASAPLIASLITLLNNERLNAGKAPLGFVNPIIYDMFDTDSQKYFNNQFATGASNGGECGPQFGFAVQPGYWSPMVGVGSPKFDQILAYVKNLP